MKASQRLLSILIVVLLESPVAFGLLSVNANNVITINPDGSLNPANAPIKQDANTYTLTNNINETIVVQRNNTLLDGQGYSIRGNMATQGIALSNTKNVTVKNTRISGFSTGIKTSRSIENTIANISVTNCTYGILVDQSPKTIIANNIIQGNKWDGIFITASPNSQITNNKVESNGKWGIYIGHSSDCTLKNNQMNGNKYNFGVSVDFYQDIDTSNTINDRTIIYWINQQNRQVPADASYVALIDSNNIDARNLHLTENGQGITLVNSANNHIENCNITSNSYYGIALIDSAYNAVSNNTIARNEGGGITLVSSTSNSVTNNTIENNYTGIHLQTSNQNYIHHNNFINNTRQAASENSGNTWDDGYPSGGNYWSNYKGKDANSDGIGDTLYTIDSDNQDKYPLMNPVMKMPINSRDPVAPIIPFLIVTVMMIMITAISTVFYKSRKARNICRQKPCSTASGKEKLDSQKIKGYV
jgi:parallel beta-helix repeat protein